MSATDCNQAGSTTKQYFTTSCFPPIANALTGYFKLSACVAPDEYYLFPLGSCIPYSGSNAGGVVYSAHSSKTHIKLEYKAFALGDCSDVGSSSHVLTALNKTCTPGSVDKGDIVGTTLPSLTTNHRYISFYADSSCNGNVQEVAHVRNGCVPIPGAYANFLCNHDGSSTVQLFGSNDYSCVQSANGAAVTVQASSCAAVGGVYFTTTCVV